MPSGRMLWIDPADGRGRIEASGREYVVDERDIEPRARASGAAVRFDVVRDGGVLRAVRGRLRRGARTSPRQHRFGSLAGNRRPEQKGRKPLTRVRTEREVRFSGPPGTVVTRWVRAANSARLDGVLPLYAPDVVLHHEGVSHAGRTRVRQALLDSGLLRFGWDAKVRGEGDLLVVQRGPGVANPGLRSRFRVLRGEIVEQWIEP